MVMLQSCEIFTRQKRITSSLTSKPKLHQEQQVKGVNFVNNPCEPTREDQKYEGNEG